MPGCAACRALLPAAATVTTLAACVPAASAPAASVPAASYLAAAALVAIFPVRYQRLQLSRSHTAAQ